MRFSAPAAVFALALLAPAFAQEDPSLLDKLGDKISHEAGGAKDAVASGVTQAAAQVTSGAAALGDDIKSVADDAKDKVTSVYDSATSKVADTANDAKSKATDIAAQASSKIDEKLAINQTETDAPSPSDSAAGKVVGSTGYLVTGLIGAVGVAVGAMVL